MFSPLKRLDIIFIAGAVLLSLLHLHFAINTDLYFKVDDFSALAYYRDHNYLQMVTEFLTQGDFFGFRRLMGHINFKIMFDLFRTNPLPYILANHLFHSVNLILLFLIAKHLSKSSLAAFLVSILYNKFYFFYFSNSHEYLLGFLSLMSIYMFIKLSNKTYLSLIFFVTALLTKEVAFSIPFFLYFISGPKKRKLLKQHFMILAIYVVYQLIFLLTGKLLPGNESYFASINAQSITDKILYFANPALLILLTLVAYFKNKLKLLSLLGVFLLALLPNLLLVNKLEQYYLYVPSAYLLTLIAILLPKVTFSNLIIYSLIFLLFGGRSVFPQIARQHFPNWDKVAIEKVVNRVEAGLSEEPINTTVNIDDINLERDARLMLEFDTLDLFIDENLAEKYSFNYVAERKVVDIFSNNR